MTDLSAMLPPMLFGDELKAALAALPEYDASVRELDAGRRLLMLSDIYKVFIPNQMAGEIYYKLYSMAAMSLQKKGTAEAVRLLNAVHQGRAEPYEETECAGSLYKGIATGMTSATCIGVSGIGKTTCIQAAAGLCGGVLEAEEPYRKIIPVVIVSCPFNCSFRSLCSQILSKVDECLGTAYFQKSQKSTMNAEQVMQMACQVANLYIGVLVIDEIQMIVESKSGSQLYRMVLQLVNSSGISVLMCGTPECIPFFGQNPQMARRTAGLQYGAMPYGEEFREFAGILFSYQYVRNRAELTDGILEWIYEHSGAIPASIMALVHDAQEIAILGGKEELGILALNEAYERRIKMLHPYITPNIRIKKKYAPAGEQPAGFRGSGTADAPDQGSIDIPALVENAKKQGLDIAAALGQHVPVREVAL